MSGQNYAQYTAEDHSVWTTLYQRQINSTRQFAYGQFSESLDALCFTENKIPSFDQINKRLLQQTGWKIYAVPGLIPNQDFFKFMAFRQFGATTWIRTLEQLDYLEEPDMFHDTFGHIPLLADPTIAAYLYLLALVAEKYLDNEEAIEQIARLYWYTIEFGLVHEQGELRIYGAGILSSIGETKFCLSPTANRVPFDMDVILETPYIKDKFQVQYFVLDSIEQLTGAVQDLDLILQSKFN